MTYYNTTLNLIKENIIMYDYTNDLDKIDAMVFSGDSLHNRKSLNNFRRLLTRWEKEVNNIEEIIEENEKENEIASPLKLETEIIHKVELDDFINFIATTKKMTYTQVEEALDSCVYEGCQIGCDDDEEIYDTLIKEMEKSSTVLNSQPINLDELAIKINMLDSYNRNNQTITK
jgi:hypothetical protein